MEEAQNPKTILTKREGLGKVNLNKKRACHARPKFMNGSGIKTNDRKLEAFAKPLIIIKLRLFAFGWYFGAENKAKNAKLIILGEKVCNFAPFNEAQCDQPKLRPQPCPLLETTVVHGKPLGRQ